MKFRVRISQMNGSGENEEKWRVSQREKQNENETYQQVEVNEI
jgi:hypothetical protein